ncbi:signal peptidase I [Actinomadura madurae]|uniref:Signal peptidase I n=1 Tax=Actinomadura madurae TaxID=1993 RepID=A0A1I5L5I7_9ACTN|nr:S26 family signal peptidase [Actinomadura madurae]SFO92515.1 signal peptidase I [Actinomadura madurae]
MTWIALAAAAALAGTAALIAWLRRRYVVIDVDGPSMQPTLHEGDRVLVRRRPLGHVRAGDIVVVKKAARHRAARRPGIAALARPRVSGRLSRHRWVIKRAAGVPGDPVSAAMAATVSVAADVTVPDGRLLVLGDNPDRSLDSRHYGYLSGDGVLGVVVRRLEPRGKEPVHHRAAGRRVSRPSRGIRGR